ncbi:hypothetical protein [Mycolicibacterium llatzerense]|uniref:hypothetical protein n=1 Tax=Mycolicibacterium llatzerense TaxID=280871 RepID=UPI0021B600B3|nr:hypothetical protein [Mycolicibacterium llatzerense]MCT7369411.1 hypothetical protein [Mycolicibacterium llatzerense]
MKFSGDYLYRVTVTAYPSGAFECVNEEADIWIPTPGWQPPGWRPVGNYTQIMGTSEFIWPVTTHVYGSRSTAEKRRKLLQSYGATAVVEQSSRIVWPTPEVMEDVA